MRYKYINIIFYRADEGALFCFYYSDTRAWWHLSASQATVLSIYIAFAGICRNIIIYSLTLIREKDQCTRTRHENPWKPAGGRNQGTCTHHQGGGATFGVLGVFFLKSLIAKQMILLHTALEGIKKFSQLHKTINETFLVNAKKADRWIPHLHNGCKIQTAITRDYKYLPLSSRPQLRKGKIAILCLWGLSQITLRLQTFWCFNKFAYFTIAE